MTTHTPGPWVAMISEGYIYSPEDGLGIARSDRRDMPSEEDANARLIAAAPDMLAALKAVVDTSHGAGPKHWAACEQASAAIAKAEGEKS